MPQQWLTMDFLYTFMYHNRQFCVLKISSFFPSLLFFKMKLISHTLSVLVITLFFAALVHGRFRRLPLSSARLQAGQAAANSVSLSHGGGNTRGLRLLGGTYAVPLYSYLLDPTLAATTNDWIEGAFDAQALGDNLFAVGYENFYSPYDNLWPTMIITNHSDGNIVETSRLSCPIRMGTTNAIASRNPARPYAVISRMTPKNATGPLELSEPAVFTILIYPINWETGVISQVTSLSLDMKTLDPYLYDLTASYNGIAGLSEDGSRLVLTWASLAIVGGNVVPVQKLAVFSINVAGTAITQLSVDVFPNPPAPTYLYFTQRALMSGNDIVICANSYSVTGQIDPYGVTGSLITYNFNPSAGSLSITAVEPYPQYCQGFDVNHGKNRIAIILSHIAGANGSLCQWSNGPV